MGSLERLEEASGWEPRKPSARRHSKSQGLGIFLFNIMSRLLLGGSCHTAWLTLCGLQAYTVACLGLNKGGLVVPYMVLGFNGFRSLRFDRMNRSLPRASRPGRRPGVAWGGISGWEAGAKAQAIFLSAGTSAPYLDFRKMKFSKLYENI